MEENLGASGGNGGNRPWNLAFKAGKESHHLAYTYDGPLVMRVDSKASGDLLTNGVNSSVEYTYDDLFRVNGSKIDGVFVEYRRDRDGLMTKVGDAMMRRHVANGRLEWVEGIGASYTYGWNNFGALKSVDAKAEATKKNVYGVKYGYDGFGRVIEARETFLGVGVSGEAPWVTKIVHYTYDALGRLLSEEEEREEKAEGAGTTGGAGKVLRKYSYVYDLRGNLVSMKANGSGSGTVTEVTAEARYGEDDRQEFFNGEKFSYSLDGHVVSRESFQGGQSSKSRTDYRWSPSGKLIGVKLPSGTEVMYTYDAFGRRASRKVVAAPGASAAEVKLGGETYYVYGMGEKPLAELDETGQVKVRYVYGASPGAMGLSPDYMTLSSKDGGGGSARKTEMYALVKDARGSVREVVRKSDGAVVAAFDYSAWGQMTLVQSASRGANLSSGPFSPSAPFSSSNIEGLEPFADYIRFGFAGGMVDVLTGLSHVVARDYDARVGRWLSKDPSGFSGGTNVYMYAAGDPVNFVDAEGLWSTYIFSSQAGSATLENPRFGFGIGPEAEFVELAGWDEDKGLFAGGIAAGGLEAEFGPASASYMEGVEHVYTKDGRVATDAVGLLGVNVERGGLNLGGGSFSSGEDGGYFLHAGIKLFGGHFDVGFGMGFKQLAGQNLLRLIMSPCRKR